MNDDADGGNEDEDDDNADDADAEDNDLTLMTPQSPGSVLCGERNNSF